MSIAMVYVIDDEATMRAAYDSLLRSVGYGVATFASGAAFRAAQRPDLPACLVLDLALPGADGLEFQAGLAAEGVLLPVIFVTGHGDVPTSVSAMKAGALEFLTKPFRDRDLLAAVERGIALDAKRRTEEALLGTIRARAETLTPREREVMGGVVAGRLNKQIAADLGLSEITVKVHRAQVMRKMQARSLPDLVRLADRLTARGGPETMV